MQIWLGRAEPPRSGNGVLEGGVNPPVRADHLAQAVHIILFDKLGLPPVKKTKTGYSTKADVLEILKPSIMA